AHRVDEDVRRLEMRRRLRMSSTPALETRERILLAMRASDLDQWMNRHAPPRRLHARRFARLLLVLRRPRRVAKSLTLVPRGQLEQGVERSRVRVDVRMRIADAREPFRH